MSAELKLWCETCEGAGTIDTTLGGDPRYTRRDEPCPDCDGNGWLAAESFRQRFVEAVNDRNDLHRQLAEAAPKAKLWDALNTALMSRSGITLDNERDCYMAAKQWAEAHDDSHSYKMAAQMAREERDAIAALKIEIASFPSAARASTEP